MWGWLEQRLIKKMEEAKVYCKNCDDWETMRIEKEFTSFKCKCGVTVYYPPTKDRPFCVKRNISSSEYYYNKEMEKEKLLEEIKNKGIQVKENE